LDAGVTVWASQREAIKRRPKALAAVVRRCIAPKVMAGSLLDARSFASTDAKIVSWGGQTTRNVRSAR
jgi:predicted phage gp36 major capsid-like protein